MKQNQGKGLFVVRNVDNWKLLFWTLHPAMKRSGLNHLHKQGLWVPLVLDGRGKWIKVFSSFLQGRHFRDAVISINKYIYSVHTCGCLHNMVNCKHCLHRQGFRTDHFTAISYFFYSFKGARNFTLHHTEVPWHNEGPRHWQNLFAMTRFQYINLGVFSICFTISRAKSYTAF